MSALLAFFLIGGAIWFVVVKAGMTPGSMREPMDSVSEFARAMTALDPTAPVRPQAALARPAPVRSAAPVPRPAPGRRPASGGRQVSRARPGGRPMATVRPLPPRR